MSRTNSIKLYRMNVLILSLGKVCSFYGNPAHNLIEFIQLVTFECECSELSVFPFEKMKKWISIPFF